MKYLVDANVLSEVTRPFPNANVVQWLRDHETDLLVNPIVLGEIEYGILLRAEGRQRRALKEWFSDRVQLIVVLPFDAGAARTWAQLLAKLKNQATPMPVKDSLVAASALQHDLPLATRNTVDFRNAGVKCVNPFQEPE